MCYRSTDNEILQYIYIYIYFIDIHLTYSATRTNKTVVLGGYDTIFQRERYAYKTVGFEIAARKTQTKKVQLLERPTNYYAVCRETFR